MGGGTRGRAVTRHALLIADCGVGVGLGHLERLLALADALRPDYSSVLVLPHDDTELVQRVVARGHEPFTVVGDTAARADAAVEATPGADIVVLDGYVFPAALQGRLRDRSPLAVLDDLSLPADCDLFVNPSPGGNERRPIGAAAFIGGAAYAVVRQEFIAAREAVMRRGRARRSVLVSTGSTDLNGIAGRVSLELLRMDPIVKVVKVVGPDARADDFGREPRLSTLTGPSSLVDGLVGATVYVGAAGTTAIQAACVGIPSVITAAVPNQCAQAAALAAEGCALAVDSEDLAATCLGLLDDPVRLDDMASRGRNLVDGLGAVRVADALRQLVETRAA